MRDAAGYYFINNRNPIVYGEIEGSSPKKLIGRQRGKLSPDLNIEDIPGAHAGTKGLGMFAQRKRITVSNSITTQDIYGAQSGTLRKGLSSKRMTNPINPEYQHLGRSQMNLRQDHVYAEPWKEEVVPRKICREKPEWKKSTVIPVIEDKKVNVSVSIEHTNPFPTAANVFFTIIY